MSDLFLACRDETVFCPLSKLPFVHMDLRYAGSNNICGQDLYQGEREAWLHHEAFEAFLRCGQALSILAPTWRFRVYDAARPASVQKRLYAQVMGTEREAYVANPANGSVHNYGFALDLGLSDAEGRELDLGTEFDSFESVSQPQLEEAYASQGLLKPAHLERRLILRTLMAAGGFRQHPLEWWHFDLRPLEAIKQHYAMI